MSGQGFDAIAVAMARARSRRALVAALAGATTIAGVLGIASPARAGQTTLVTPVCRGFRSKCKRGGQCCSGQCRKRRRKNGKKKGKCRCSPYLTPCHEDGDCCLLDGLPLVCVNGNCET